MISEKDINGVLELIRNNPVCAIEAATGTGKSTTIIEAIHRSEDVRIIISEPTIPGTESLWRYMGKRLGPKFVGMAAEGNIRYNDTSRVMYVTSGHLRRKFLSYFRNGEAIKDFTDCDVLYLDEAHIGSIDIEVITALWNHAYNKGVCVPRLVLASATLSMESSIFKKAPVYKIESKAYPVELEYHNKNYKAGNKTLYSDLARIVIERHKKYPIVGEETSKWMVFVAGKGSVEDICDLLRNAKDLTLVAMPAYSNLDSKQLDRIFEKPDPGTRVVIVATNIAEMSITIDDLEAIFDSMEEKTGSESSSGGFRLSLHHISKASAQQRKGRTGRTRPGSCYRMCTEEFYNRLPEQRLPDIMRVPLHTTTIELLDIGISPLEIFEGRLTSDRLSVSINLLRRLNMIDKDDEVMEMGRFAPQLPISVRGSAILYHWIKAGLPVFPCIVSVALMECYKTSYYFYPFQNENESREEYGKRMGIHYETYFKQFEAPTDLEVLFSIWNSLYETLEGIDPPRYKLVAWSNEHSMNAKRIAELLGTIRQTCNALIHLRKDERLPDFYVKIDFGFFNHSNVIEKLLPILETVYSDQILVRSGNSWFDPFNRSYYKLGSGGLSNAASKVSRIIAISTSELHTDAQSSGYFKDTTRFVSLCQPLNTKESPPKVISDVSVAKVPINIPAPVPIPMPTAIHMIAPVAIPVIPNYKNVNIVKAVPVKIPTPKRNLDIIEKIANLPSL